MSLRIVGFTSAGLLLLASAVAFAQDRPAEEQKVIDRIKALKGQVEFDRIQRGTPVVGVSFSSSNGTDELLASLVSFPELRFLEIRSPDVTDKGLKHLLALKKLEYVSLLHLRLTDAGIKDLEEAIPKKARAGLRVVKMPGILQAGPLQTKEGDNELRKLLVARYNAAVEEMEGEFQMFMAGRSPFQQLVGAARRLVDSGSELNEKHPDRLALLQQYVELLKVVEKEIQSAYDAGRASKIELPQVRYLRLDAEIEFLRAKTGAERGKGK